MKLPRYRRGEYPSVKITPARVVIVILTAALVVACGAALANPQAQEQRQQDAIMQHYLDKQALPTFSEKSILRQNLIELEHAQVVGSQSTTFFCPGMGCDAANPPTYTCQSIGFPIHSTDQLSNPNQPLRDNSDPLNNGGGNVVVGNMDPNGVYPGSSTGTTVQCIGPTGAATPVYWEGNVLTVLGPATWDKTTGTITITGPPSFQFTR